jgi:site-specific DNA recombinase
MKKAFGYIRVSTVGQAEEGFSLDHQKASIADYCKTRNIHLANVFVDEGKSGRTVNRHEFQQMLEEIKDKGVDCVVIYKIDRFARNVNDFSRVWNEFKENGINLISVLEGDLSSSSSLIPNIFASVAQWESEVNGQRTRDALMEKFKSGWQPTPSPIGYRSIGGEGERKYCEIDPCSGPIIKKMFELLFNRAILYGYSSRVAERQKYYF